VSRRGALLALVAAGTLTAGSVVVFALAVLLGAFVPAGRAVDPPEPTPATVTYGEFLDEVRSGQVVVVSQRGQILVVETVERTYEVTVPSPETDVIADMETAALNGGTHPPAYEANPP